MSSEPRPLALLTVSVRTATAGDFSAAALAAVSERARQALAAADSPQSLKLVADKLDGLARVLLRQRTYRDEANALLVVKTDAERMLGEMLKPIVTGGSHVKTVPPGITHRESSLWKRLASVPDEEYQAIKDRLVRRGVMVSTSRVLRDASAYSPRKMRRCRAA